MPSKNALAYFITFSTYGTWLHGTGKGLGSVDRDHNRFGDDFVELIASASTLPAAR